MSDVQLEPGWKMALMDEFEKPYMLELKSFLRTELDNKKKVYPKPSEYFNAFNSTPIEDVRVVIIGQDPYHGPGQAHGLSFSVPEGVALPPSLLNIYKELSADLGVETPKSGDLTHWAKQGVLLLNATLSVEAHKAGSHQKRGWETFTDKAIEVLSEMGDGIVFVLWGAYAQKKGEIIDESRHKVLKAPHPSPLSAHRGFFGSKPFSQINNYLESVGEAPIRRVL
ncbi:MAG: uracil-DNA glycosylase [Bdellovibrionales bacterium]|nr:uracil-DNA glycosylase [Bdellovibrionales bacterium]